jgi:hypothetical protein
MPAAISATRRCSPDDAPTGGAAAADAPLNYNHRALNYNQDDAPAGGAAAADAPLGSDSVLPGDCSSAARGVERHGGSSGGSGASARPGSAWSSCRRKTSLSPI